MDGARVQQRWIATLPALSLFALWVGLGGPSLGAGIESWDAELWAGVQEARSTAGQPPFQREPALDRAALARAEHVAGLPHRRRLAVDQSVGKLLEAHGVRRFRNAAIHLDMQRGYTHPASRFYDGWRKHRGFWRVTDPRFNQIGLALAHAADGWIIFVAIVVEEERIPDDLAAVESETHERINEQRHSVGLAALERLSWLDEVARQHSQDMASRDYFGHRSPEGRVPKDRVKPHLAKFRQLAENIYSSRGIDPAVDGAVESWMASRGHRKNIVNPDFVQTGIGVAVDRDGRLFFTQLFLTP